MTIGFNYIPGSGLTAPIFAFEVNSGGQYYAVDALVLMGHKLSAGTMALNTPTVVASQADADALAGPGSMLREMYRLAAMNAPATPIKLLAVAEPSGAQALWTISIGSLPAGGGVAVVEIQGKRISVGVSATDTPTTVAQALGAAINAYYDSVTGAMLQVVAQTPITTATILLNARHVGAIMNDIDIYVPASVVGNVLAASGVWTLTATTAGAGIPTLSSALAALGDDPADFIVSPWSDSTSTAAYASITNDVSGRWAWSRQSYGHVWSVFTGTFSASTTLGLALNDRHLTVLRRWSGAMDPSWTWAAAVTARLAPWLSDCVTGNVSRNQTNLPVVGLRGLRDRSGLDQYSARNTLVNSGISTMNQLADGTVVIDKIVTTYRAGPQGQPDTVFRDIQAVYQVAGGLGYIRSAMQTECGNKGLVNSNPGNLAALVTPSDIKASFMHAYSDLCNAGVFQNLDGVTRALIVAYDSANPDRVNIYAAFERVNPGDIFATNATIYQRLPA